MTRHELAAQPPAMRPPPSQEATTDVFQAFGQPAMWLAVFGSLLTRRPLTAAIQAAGTVLNSTHQLDEAAAKKAYDTWKVESENGLKMAQFEQTAYRNALQKYATDARAGEAELRTLARAYKNAALTSVLDTEGMGGAHRFVNANGQQNTRLATETRKLNTTLEGIAINLHSDDPTKQADGLESWAARNISTLAARKATPEQRAVADGQAIRVGQIVLDLRSGDPDKIAAAQKMANEILGAGTLKPAPAAKAPPAGSTAAHAVAIEADIRKEHPDWTDGQVAQEAIKRSKGVPTATTYRPETLDRMADEVAKGGPPPRFAYGVAGNADRQAFQEALDRRLAKDDMAGGDLVGVRAGQAADKQALTQAIKQRTAIASFADTALANGDVLLDLAKAVDTTGVPVVERWIRAGRRAVDGDPDVTAFNAQLHLWSNEMARIIANPNLAGVLTDAARQEIQSFVPESISAAQLERLIPLLKADAGRREKAIDDQIAVIRERMKRPTGPAASDHPTLQQFLEKARAVNPGVSDADLTAYYKQKYGG